MLFIPAFCRLLSIVDNWQTLSIASSTVLKCKNAVFLSYICVTCVNRLIQGSTLHVLSATHFVLVCFSKWHSVPWNTLVIPSVQLYDKQNMLDSVCLSVHLFLDTFNFVCQIPCSLKGKFVPRFYAFEVSHSAGCKKNVQISTGTMRCKTENILNYANHNARITHVLNRNNRATLFNLPY